MIYFSKKNILFLICNFLFEFHDRKIFSLSKRVPQERIVHRPANLLKVGRRCGTPRLTTMISIDGRLREKSNAKVVMNESRAANAEENELPIGKIADNRVSQSSHFAKRLQHFYRRNNDNLNLYLNAREENLPFNKTITASVYNMIDSRKRSSCTFSTLFILCNGKNND